jgi:hypothetical protein
VKLTANTTGYSQTETIDVAAGKITEINLGGVGRPIVGRIKVPAELAAKIDWGAGQSTFSSKVAQPPLPADWQTMEPAARQKWIAAFQQSPAGRAYEKLQATRKHFTLKVASDGSFRTDDVPAGVYQAIIVLKGTSQNELRIGGEVLATAISEFTVPEMPDGPSDEPLDIGAIDAKPIGPVNPVAPK